MILGPEPSTANSHIVPAKHTQALRFADIRNMSLSFSGAELRMPRLSDCKAKGVCTDEVGQPSLKLGVNASRVHLQRGTVVPGPARGHSAESWRSGTQGNRPPSGCSYSNALTQPRGCWWPPCRAPRAHVLTHAGGPCVGRRFALQGGSDVPADVRASTNCLHMDFLTTCCPCTSRGSWAGS